MTYIPNSKLVNVLDKSIVVHEATMLSSTRLNLMQKRFQKEVEDQITDVTDPLEINLIANFCMPIVCCSESLDGDMWDAFELVKLPEREMDKLFEAAREINPHWFPGFNSNGNSVEEAEKKTSP